VSEADPAPEAPAERSRPSTPGVLEADQMAYQARALAQSEPFTLMARRFVDRAMEEERNAQPGNFAIWANAAFTKGYCVRRVEEEDVGRSFTVAPDDALPDPAELEKRTDEIFTALRSEDSDLSGVLISDEDRMLDVLDQVIASEVRNRIENAGNMSSRAKVELEDYMTYWVVRGYALRVAEQTTGAIVPV
jgi:hypothetical protein